jgi:hypothetical protein
MDNWQADNHTALIGALAQMRQILVDHADPQLLPDLPAVELGPPMALPSTLEQLSNLFDLSQFEQLLLLLCAGVELDASFSVLCAAAQGDAQRNYPTFSLALAILPEAHWSALLPTAALRRWRLIELGSGNSLTTTPLRIGEWVLHYLVGVAQQDERLMNLVQPVVSNEDLVLSHWELSEQLVAAWSGDAAMAQLPILQLCGTEVTGKRAIAAVACHFCGLNLYSVAAYTLPSALNDLLQFRQLWEREALLMGHALLIDCDHIDPADSQKESAIAYLSETLNCPVMISSLDRRRPQQRPLLAFDVEPPEPQEQRHIWQAALGSQVQLNGQVDQLVAQFNLSAPVIQATCAKVQAEFQRQGGDSDEAEPAAPDADQLLASLWATCRSQARPRLDDLAQRIDCAADWDDLILPESQRQVLRDMAAHVHQRAKVYESWGFGGKSRRGLGTSALFSGGSGTGKTMSSEVLAKTLKLDLYRIDLSAVISKYIGETEKNLRRVFDAAETGGVILLFDEADALFGKRTEVKDSHDRHANVEVSYLLQRMESYRGLSILTTNLKSSLDTAFMRRLRFVVQFPFPDASQRAEIWRRVFPQKTPTEDLKPEKLAQLNVAGGNIRNIAVNAAFLAAEANQPVKMEHLLTAAQAEYIKIERPLTDTEVRGWLN